jgi:hypothetical protein
MNNSAGNEACLKALSGALQNLQLTAESKQLEFISEILTQSMSGQWRSFHTLDHVFNVAKGGDPIEVIAALFHDVIYMQVDQAININAARFVHDYIEERHSALFIRDSIAPEHDPIFKLVLDLFGFHPGEELKTLAGQNEFISALLACKVLDGIAPLGVLAKVTACIEATIPFRPEVVNQDSSSDKLLKRLSTLNEELSLGLTEQDLIDSVKRSVRLSNRDVENFSSQHPAQFLDETWNLIPETNHDLLRANAYTVKQYRISLQKMEGFLNFLSPQVVFKQYLDEPNDAQFKLLNEKTERNIRIARLYLGMKLTSIGVLEALSLRLGGDVSISMMMGELPQEGKTLKTMASFLPEIANIDLIMSDDEKEVLSLLEEGRHLNTSYDLKNSPIAAYMLKSIGFEKMKGLLKANKAFFSGEISAEQLITQCPSEVIQDISNSILCLFDERKMSLHTSV